MAIDKHPSGSILATGNLIKVVLLPDNTRTPTTYTITLGAGPFAQGDTTLEVASVSPAPTADAPLYLEDGLELDFGGQTVTVDNADPDNPVQIITSGTTFTLNVAALGATQPAGAATATTVGLMEILGVQNIDYNKNSNLISIRDQKSGLGNEQRTVMVSYEASLSGWIHQRSNAYRYAVKDAAETGKEMYFEMELSDGRKVTGVCGASNLTNSIQLDQVMNFNVTLFVQGVPVETYTV